VKSDTLPGLIVARAVLAPVALRAKAEDEPAREGLGLLDVRFSPFNQWYRIDSWFEGTFLERTVPGAFKRTFGQHNDANSSHAIRTLFNHGHDLYIGDKLLGEVDEVAEDDDSARSTVWLWDTSYNRDLLPGLRAGSYGSSFMFQTLKEEWNAEPEPSDYNPEGIPERTIKEARVLEAGPVTWPANPAATAGMRCVSTTDQHYELLARRDPSRVAELRSQISALRAADHAPALAPETPTDSGADTRSVGLSPRERREALYPYLREAR
jgi:HK97 family phage prohead protease